MKHKHAELIKAWADGAEIQFLSSVRGGWVDAPDPTWWTDTIYRIKPEPKPDVVFYGGLTNPNGYVDADWTPYHSSFCQNIKVIFDGETGEPKSAEVIK